jgi:hypothetical protein
MFISSAVAERIEGIHHVGAGVEPFGDLRGMALRAECLNEANTVRAIRTHAAP